MKRSKARREGKAAGRNKIAKMDSESEAKITDNVTEESASHLKVKESHSSNASSESELAVETTKVVAPKLRSYSDTSNESVETQTDKETGVNVPVSDVQNQLRNNRNKLDKVERKLLAIEDFNVSFPNDLSSFDFTRLKFATTLDYFNENEKGAFLNKIAEKESQLQTEKSQLMQENNLLLKQGSNLKEEEIMLLKQESQLKEKEDTSNVFEKSVIEKKEKLYQVNVGLNEGSKLYPVNRTNSIKQILDVFVFNHGNPDKLKTPIADHVFGAGKTVFPLILIDFVNNQEKVVNSELSEPQKNEANVLKNAILLRYEFPSNVKKDSTLEYYEFFYYFLNESGIDLDILKNTDFQKGLGPVKFDALGNLVEKKYSFNNLVDFLEKYQAFVQKPLFLHFDEIGRLENSQSLFYDLWTDFNPLQKNRNIFLFFTGRASSWMFSIGDNGGGSPGYVKRIPLNHFTEKDCETIIMNTKILVNGKTVSLESRLTDLIENYNLEELCQSIVRATAGIPRATKFYLNQILSRSPMTLLRHHKKNLFDLKELNEFKFNVDLVKSKMEFYKEIYHSVATGEGFECSGRHLELASRLQVVSQPSEDGSKFHNFFVPEIVKEEFYLLEPTLIQLRKEICDLDPVEHWKSFEEYFSKFIEIQLKTFKWKNLAELFKVQNTRENPILNIPLVYKDTEFTGGKLEDLTRLVEGVKQSKNSICFIYPTEKSRTADFFILTKTDLIQLQYKSYSKTSQLTRPDIVEEMNKSIFSDSFSTHLMIVCNQFTEGITDQFNDSDFKSYNSSADIPGDSEKLANRELSVCLFDWKKKDRLFLN